MSGKVADKSASKGHARPKPCRQLSLRQADEAFPPVFQRHIGDKRVQEGESLNLECVVFGNPKPSVKWFHNGKRIVDRKGSIQLQSRSKKHSLTIPSTLPEDKGLYIVRAVNSEGVVHCGAEIIITEKTPDTVQGEDYANDFSVQEGDIVITPTDLTGDNSADTKGSGAKSADKMQAPCTKASNKSSGPAKTTERHKIRHGDSGVYSMEMDDDTSVGDEKQKDNKMKERKSTKELSQTPASFLSQIRDVMIKEGNEVRFMCHISGDPKPQVKWLHNNKVLLSTHDPRIQEDGYTTTLTIYSALLTDMGEYSCEIYNGVGEKKTSSAKLTVQPDKNKKATGRPPEFVEFFKDQMVCEGQEVSFVCKVRGNPLPKVMWFYNQRPIHESGDFKFHHENFTHRLQIVEVFPEDEGEYTCKAVNSLGEKQVSAELFVEEQTTTTINKGPQSFAKPSFLIHVEDAKCWEGNGATFDCKVTGLPEPEVQWYHDGKEIEDTNQGHYIIDRSNAGNCMLVIPHATVADAGEYACIAKSNLGTAHSLAELVVLEGSEDLPSVHRGSGSKESKYIEQFGQSSGGWLGSKPRISDIHQNGITLSWSPAPVKKSSSQLSYILEARDSHSKQWTLLATDILDTKFCIEELDPEGSYMFRVRAESESGISEPGEESDLIRLKDVGNKPLFVNTTEEVFTVKEGKATLSCTVTGDPKPKVTWMREEEILKTNDVFKISAQPNGVCTLEVQKVTSNDIGEYRCIATNEHGETSCRLYLDVAEPPHFVEAFRDTEATLGQTIRLNCNIDGIPEPEVIWTKNGKVIDDFERYQFFYEGEDGFALEISNFDKEDCGVYAVEATNIAGSANHASEIYITSGPDGYRRVFIKKDIKVEDEYELLTELGRGAYGVVHKAVSKADGGECAVKTIRVKAGMWEEVRNEIAVMGVLDHKRLIKLFDAYETKREVIMAMEIVTGGELFERIVTRDSFSESEAVAFLKQIMDGLIYMHDRNIVHLDLKPENILLVTPESDDIKLIDFGLAAVLKEGEEVRCKFGTPEFVAPEVVNKQPVSTAADVWGVGVIAYILLSGISPFAGEDDRQTLLNVRGGQWDFDDEVWDDISDEAQDFIWLMFEMNDEKRPSLRECLEHPWLKFDERQDLGAKISLDRLRTFNSRRKWRKALTAVKSAMRLRRLSSLGSNLKKAAIEHTSQQSPSSPISPDSPSSDVFSDDSGPKYGNFLSPTSCETIAESLLEGGAVGGAEKDSDQAPVFEVELKDITVMEMSELELTCQVTATPKPTMTWYHEDTKLTKAGGGARRLQIGLEKGKAFLRIPRISKADAGLYKCVATNKVGTVESTATLSVAAVPDAPSRPKIPLVSAHEAFVTWKMSNPPKKDDLEGYLLQCRKAGDKQWLVVSDVIKECNFHVKSLSPENEYRFRVACRSPHGPGPFSKSSVQFKTLPEGAEPLNMESITKLQHSRTRSLSRERHNSRDLVLSDLIDDEDLGPLDLSLKTSVMPQKIYEMQEEIGRGRYSVIMRCRRAATCKEYAVKILAYTKKTQDKCLAEYELLKELSHPHILQLRDAFLTNRHVMLITERYYGGSVLKYLTKDESYSEPTVVRIVAQILDALEHLHVMNVVYLDLRHDNVMMESRRKDVVRLIDFGSCRVIKKDGGQKMKNIDVLPEFLAPELVVKGGLIDYETDLWPLGVMVFTWLSGITPFLGRNHEKTVYNVTRVKYNLASLFPNVSEEAKQFVQAILKEKPMDRPTVAQCLEHDWVKSINRPGAAQSRSFPSERLATYRNNYILRQQQTCTADNVTLRTYGSGDDADES
ncbi:protein Obscurin-like [Diadema antillarum]|uniref:protein Obscurin-like n=1 Tax=Diadema antillarum TaxID=105358 RepID=UPI003A853EAA